MMLSLLNRALSILALAGVATSAGAQSGADKAVADGVVQLKCDDLAMARAIQRARARLPQFLSLAANPRANMRDFSLKVGIPVGPNVEYVWVRPFDRNGDGYKGRLVNDATIMPNLKYGQWISFDEDNIADWPYLDGNRMIGNETACALMRRLPIAEQAAFKQRYRLTCDE